MSDPSPAAYAALARELNEARAYQAAVDEILHLVGTTPNDSQPVFDAIVAHAMTLCDAEAAMAARRDGARLHLMASIADESDVNAEAVVTLRTLFPMTLDTASPSALAVRDGCTVHIADLLELATLNAGIRGRAQLSGTRSALAVPILRGGSVLGVVTVYRTVPGLFSGAQVKLLETFAAQAAIALDNARLFNETREALEQQTAISDILRITTESPTDVQPVLDAIADHAVRLCDAASASLFLIEGDGLRHVSTRGALVDPATAVELLPIDSTSTSGRAVLECRVVQVDDMQAEAHEYPRGHEYAQRLGHRSIAVAPLCREGKPFGTLLWRCMEVRPFNAREVALLRTFGDQAAIALESTRLFNETQQALERQTALSEVLRVISESPTDAAPVFDAIAARAARLCKAQMGLSFRFDGALLHLIGVHGVSRDGEEAVGDFFRSGPTPSLLSAGWRWPACRFIRPTPSSISNRASRTACGAWVHAAS